MKAPKIIHKKVKQFAENEKSLKNGPVNEVQFRTDYIMPLFKALGWNVYSEGIKSEYDSEVIREHGIKVGGRIKFPDFTFKLGNDIKFFVETKYPTVNIKKHSESARQLRWYGLSAELPLSILTDFEEFAIYDCRFKPHEKDNAEKALHDYFTYDKYPEKWGEIYDLFSREAVDGGSLDKFAEKPQHGTIQVDKLFLEELEIIRKKLASDIFHRNPKLSLRELNEFVVKTIDRILFLRICEDRDIETYGRLEKLTRDKGIYTHLCKLYQDADEKYNSGLFHFSKERGRPFPPDEQSLKLKIDDKVLKDIIRRLYPPNSYMFSVFPVEILGQIYERFLGEVIIIKKSGCDIDVEEKPEVKKAGGVYYTPRYIVRYIVKNTVGKLLKGKSIKQVEKLKILDPACGSGSFLLEAYQFILDWHLTNYTKNNPKKHSKLYKTKNKVWRLKTSEKKRILLNNIFGVDIDKQAVEVAKLSLLLKVLEGETAETIQRELFIERVLPDLGNNMKCGNSLINTDFNDELDVEEMIRINAFDWEIGFPEVFKHGGFDAVIGNPPYGDYFNEEEKGFLLKKYSKSFSGTFDIYIAFFEIALHILKNKGILSFITPNTFIEFPQFINLRKLLLHKNNIEQLLSLRNVFDKPIVDNIIIILSKGTQSKKTFKGQIFKEKTKLTEDSSIVNIPYNNLNEDSFKLKTFKNFNIDKLWSDSETLDYYVKITQGITTGGNSFFINDFKHFKQTKIPQSLMKKVLKGKNISRYSIQKDNDCILYVTKGISQNEKNVIVKYLNPFKKKLSKKRETKQGKLPWFCLHWPRNEKDFMEPKILIRQTASRIIGALDAGKYYPIDTVHTLNLKIRDTNLLILLKYILGILNSSLFAFIYDLKLDEKGKVFPQIKKANIECMPIKKYKKAEKISSKVDRILELNKQLAKATHGKTVLQTHIEATDRQIDQLVYKLYGLTKREIEIVEKNQNC